MNQQRPSGSDRVLILAADTTVSLDTQMLGKPLDSAHAVRMLCALRGREHEVYTGMSLVDVHTGQEETAVHCASVTMRPYSDEQIERYAASGDPLDKAGAYAIQHPWFRPAADLQGCYLGVMGLSICQLIQLASNLDVPHLADLGALHEAHHHFPCPLFDDLAQKL